MTGKDWIAKQWSPKGSCYNLPDPNNLLNWQTPVFVSTQWSLGVFWHFFYTVVGMVARFVLRKRQWLAKTLLALVTNGGSLALRSIVLRFLRSGSANISITKLSNTQTTVVFSIKQHFHCLEIEFVGGQSNLSFEVSDALPTSVEQPRGRFTVAPLTASPRFAASQNQAGNTSAEQIRNLQTRIGSENWVQASVSFEAAGCFAVSSDS